MASSQIQDTPKLPILLQLPDEILVNIGRHVAKLCGARDYCCFSQTSKRIRCLLLRHETITSVLQEANARFRKNRSSLLLPSWTETPISVRTLQQWAFLECLLEHEFLAENRFHPRFGAKVRAILNRFPSAVLVLDAHGGRGDLMARTPYGFFDYRAKHAYEKIISSDTASNILPERIRIRVWGRRVAAKASESEHPYSTKARKGKGWVELFFQLQDGEDLLELPPRPDFYKDVPIPRFQRYEMYVDSSDSESDDGHAAHADGKKSRE